MKFISLYACPPARPGVESNRPIVPTPELGIACLMVSMVGMPELGRLLNNRWIQLRAVNKRAIGPSFKALRGTDEPSCAPAVAVKALMNEG